MEEQSFILKNPESFNLVHIFECGQCFRWNLESDGSYTGVIKDGVLNVKEDGNNYIFKGSLSRKIKDVVYNYFDLKTNYFCIKEKLSGIDEFMKESINFGYGIRILNQDLWECIISFIISANNNIPRIKKIIEKLCINYGKEIEFNGKKYYTFPTSESLSKATVEDLRKIGLGFRDKRVFRTTKMVLDGEINLEELKACNNTTYIKNELLKLDGVGEKVANCIMLFSLKRFDTFPIDVWVRRVINDLYIHEEQEEKVSQMRIKELAEEKFSNYQGLAQQYLFYWRKSFRDTSLFSKKMDRA